MGQVPHAAVRISSWS